MIPGVSSCLDSSGLIITAEADESLRNLKYFGLAKKEMHPEDAFLIEAMERIATSGSPISLPLTMSANSLRLYDGPDKLSRCLRHWLQRRLALMLHHL